MHMKAELLISTTNRSDVGFLKRMISNVGPDDFSATIINQCYSIKPPTIVDSANEKIISVADKGLSKSRNMAIDNANGDICVIADDDLVYLPDAVAKITVEYRNDKELDVAIFQVITPEGELYKKYNPKSFRIKKAWDQYRISSVEITFSRERIIEKGIRFNENLGLGAPYTSGEEAMFIHDCVKRGLKVKYFPVPIVEHPKESSGKVYSKSNALAKGIVFFKLFPLRFLLFDLYFSVKWYKTYKKDFSYFQYLGWMLKGNWLALKKRV